MKKLGITLISALLLGCAGGAVQSEPPGQLAGAPSTIRDDVLHPGRWLLWPDDAAADFFLEDPGGGRRIIASGLRLLRRSDGSIEQSHDFMPADAVRAIPLPARLGGGYLFVAESGGQTLLWRADSWVSPLKALARVSDRVEAIVVGFDRLYLELPLIHRWGALDTSTGALRDLAPLPDAPGYSSMVFADAWFGAVSSDVLGVQVTFDAGASWQALAGVGNDAKVQSAGSDIVVESSAGRFRLGRDGHLKRYASAQGQELFADQNEQALGALGESEQLASLARKPTHDGALRDAVLFGWPLNAATAVVASQGGLAIVRLSDGAVLQVAPNLYPGDNPCQALPLGNDLGFVCQEQPTGTALYRLTQPLALTLVKRFLHTRSITHSGFGALVISGSCDSELSPSALPLRYCLRDREGNFREVRVRGDVGVERVAALPNGDAAVLVPPRLGASGLLLRISADEQTSVSLDLSDVAEDEAFLQTAMWLEPLISLGERGVATWAAGARSYRGVLIAPDGSVTTTSPPHGGVLSRAVFSGPIAFEASPSGVAWTSTNFGQDWTKLDAPPGFFPLDERSALSLLGAAPRLGCSAVGCAYGHWLRVGHPASSDPGVEGELSDAGSPEEDAPSSTSGGNDETPPLEPLLSEAPAPKAVNFNPSSYFEWRLHCQATGKPGPSPQALATQLNKAALETPRRGLVTSFLPPLLAALPASAGGAVFRPWLGLEGPRVPKAGLRFDQGSDSAPRFHAYAWGGASTLWAATAAWQVRVSSWFDDDGVWATAPTYAPWSDAQLTAEIFGAAEGARSGADWTLELDPSEEGGILRIGTNLSSELHVVSQGRVVQSYGAISGGRLAGAVKSDGQWYYGQHEGNEFRVLRLEPSGPVLLGTYAVDADHRASLVRSTDAVRLGILVRTRSGSFYLYPLAADAAAEVPLTVSREQLNSTPARCDADSSGWLAVLPTPLTRLDGSTDNGFITFSGAFANWRAKGAVAKVVIRDGSACVVELGAEVAGGDALSAATEAVSKGGVRLTVAEIASGRRWPFRCSF